MGDVAMPRKPKKQPVETGPSQVEILERANEALRVECERLRGQNERLFERVKGLQRLSAMRNATGEGDIMDEEDEE